MSDEETQPEDIPEDFGADDQADQPEPTSEVSEKNEVTDESVQEVKPSKSVVSPTTAHTPLRKLAPIATSTPRSIKINVQHEGGQLKNIILDDDQLGQATIDFSDISKNATSGTGHTHDLTDSQDLLHVSVTNLSSNDASQKCPGKNCECVEKHVPKFTRQIREPPSDEDTSLMLQSALGTSLLDCQKVLELPPPVRSSTPITTRSLAAQYARPMAQAPPDQSSFRTINGSGPPNVPCPQNVPCPPNYGSPIQRSAQGAQQPCSGLGQQNLAQLPQSGSPYDPQGYQSRRPCPGGQISQRPPRPLPPYGGGYADSSVYLQTSRDNFQTQEYNLPRYQESGNESSWLAPPPQRSQCPGQGSRTNRSMPLGPVSSGKQCPDKPRCPPMSQDDTTLQQLETTNNRLMNLGRQVVDMRAELQPTGGCNEKPPCGDNRNTVADALEHNQNIVCDLERKITHLQNEMKEMLCSTTQSNQFSSASTSQRQKPTNSSVPKKTCCMKCKCKKPHTGSPCKN